MTKTAHKKAETEAKTEEAKAPESAQQALEKAGTAVAVNQTGGALASPVAGFTIDDLALDQGAGTQNVTATDLSTPIISVLQSNSPQCKRSDPKYIEGAKEGDLYNNVTNEVYDGEHGLVVVPCYFEKVFIEWRPNRGGLVGIHKSDTPLRDQVKMVKNAEGKDIPTLPSGNNLIETNQHYVLLLTEGNAPEGAVISMASSQLKSSRLWNTLIKKVQLQDSKGNFFVPASYYMTYRLTTKSRQKDTHTWCVWSVEPNGPVPSKAVYDAGKALEKAVASGTVKVKVDESAQGNEPAGVAHETESEIPF